MFQHSDIKKVEQHRLKCILGGQSSSVILNGSTSASQHTPADFEQKVSQILLRVGFVAVSSKLLHCLFIKQKKQKSITVTK